MKINKILINNKSQSVIYEGVLVKEKGYNILRKTKYLKSHGHGTYTICIPVNVDAVYIRHEYDKYSTMEWLYIVHFQNGIPDVIMNTHTFHDDKRFSEKDRFIKKKIMFDSMKKHVQTSYPINLLDEL